MCNYFSCLVLRDLSVVWSPSMKSHEDLLEQAHLKDDKLEDRDFVRIEITPKDPAHLTRDPAAWTLKVDEESTLPKWFRDQRNKAKGNCWAAWAESVKVNIALGDEQVTITGHFLFASDNARVSAQEHSTVIARGHSSVEAHDDSSVEAHDNSSVIAWGNSLVSAHEKSFVSAQEHSSVYAWDNSSVEAHDDSTVIARKNSSVSAWDNSSVSAREHSLVSAHENSMVIAQEHSSVEAHDDSSVSAQEHSTVIARGHSKISGHGAAKVKLYDQATLTVCERCGQQITFELLSMTAVAIKDGKVYVAPGTHVVFCSSNSGKAEPSKKEKKEAAKA